MALAFIPSSLMLAVTTYFSTDIAPVPLFWIAPLALYLLTFVAAFGTRAASVRSIADRFMPLAVLPLVLLMVARLGLPLALAIPLHLGAFTLAALVCHGRLAAIRPHPAHLTEFYFWIAFGGMLGGMFNTLAAPLLFSQIIEYPLVLVLALAARRGRRPDAGLSWSLNDLLVPVAVGALCAAALVWRPGGDTNAVFVAGLGVPAFVAFTQSRAAMRFAASVATMLVAGSLAANAQAQALHVSRTFFGVYRLTMDQAGRHHSLFHGTTLHGMQALDPAHQSEPLTYYGREGPIGQAFAGLPAAVTSRDIAVVGLGIGTLASYRTPGQQWTFYEIDPEVERIARAEKYFTFMRSCGDACRVVQGDARLSLARAPLSGVRGHHSRCVQLRRHPHPPDDQRSAGAVFEPPRARRRAGVSHLEPAPGSRAGAGANRAQPRACGAAAKAQHRSENQAGALLLDLDGDGEKRVRSRQAGDRCALERAGDSAGDAVVDRRFFQHRQRAEPERPVAMRLPGAGAVARCELIYYGSG
jgi:hypothetical protein